jgi:hypothetical protein
MENFITYDGLPISSGGAHRINGRPANEIYDSLSKFTSTLTNTNKPHRLFLEYNSTISSNASKFKTVWKLILACGPPKLSLGNYYATRQLKWRWMLRTGSMNKAIKLQSQYENITLSVLWYFYFIDLNSKKMLPGQDAIPVIHPRLQNSHIYWRHGKTSSISLWFILPFNELDTATVDYIKLLQAHLPVKLSKNHWRIWRKNKNGPSPRKLILDFLT